jgi:hypothetical protein
MTAEEFNLEEKKQDAIFRALMYAVSLSGSKEELTDSLSMVTAMAIAILRGLKGEEFVESYLNAALADKGNVIGVELVSVHGGKT